MKPGDLVSVIDRYATFWRERSHPLGGKDFRVESSDMMVVVEGPWTEEWFKPETGSRKETFVIVMHPEHKIVRGYAKSLMVISEGTQQHE